MFNKYHAMVLAIVLASYAVVATTSNTIELANFALLCKGVVVAIMLLCLAVAERKDKQVLAH